MIITFRGIAFWNKKEGLILNSSALFKTTNQGYDWEKFKLPTEYKPNIIDAAISLRGNKVLIAANQRVFMSEDRGLTWKTVHMFPLEEYMFIAKKILFVNDSTIFIGGGRTSLNSNIYKSTDGGFTWTRKYTGNDEFITDMDFIDENNIAAISHYSRLLRTKDGGETWTSTDVIHVIEARSVCYKSLDTIFVTGRNRLAVYSCTFDGGKTWNHPSSIIINNREFFFYWGNQVKKYYDRIVFSVDTYQNPRPEHLNADVFYSEDNGENWNWNYTTLVKGYIHDLKVDDGIVLACADGGLVMYRDSSGIWKHKYPDNSQNSTVQAAGFHNNWLLTYYDKFLKYVSLNDSKEVSTNGIEQPFTAHAIDYYDGSHKAVVGDKGDCYVSYPPQGKFNRKDFSTLALYDIKYLDKDRIIACGQGQIFISTDEGRSFKREYNELFREKMIHIETFDDGMVYIAGVAGTYKKNFNDPDSEWRFDVSSPNEAGYQVQDIDFYDKETAYMIAYKNNTAYLLQSLDSGKTWYNTYDYMFTYKTPLSVAALEKNRVIVSGAAGMLMDIDLMPDNTTGVDIIEYGNQKSAENHIKFYPNPAKDFIIFPDEAFELVKVDIYDIRGKFINQSMVIDHKLDTRELNKGAYIMKIRERSVLFIID